MMSRSVETIIVDNHKIFREGLKCLLKTMEKILIVGEASNGTEFLELLKIKKPQLAILDNSISGMDGIKAVNQVLKKYPEIKIIILSMYADEESYNHMVQAGVKGYVLKESGCAELKEAINKVINGGSYFSQELLQQVIKKIGNGITQKDESLITHREKEVLQYICQGMSNHEIADVLHLSHRTVEGHRANLLKKTATKNTINLIMYSIKNKLVDLSVSL